MEKYLAMIEPALGEALGEAAGPAAALVRAMRHAVGAGGKRLRPILALAAAEAAGGAARDALPVATAIELLHNYTLVHDDLPAMDNDRTRRGQPSVWAAFDEATAILAGDALQALAFKQLASVTRNQSAVLAAFAERAFGVVCGQVADVARDLPSLPYIYEHKTADLFMAAAECGALAAGAAPEHAAALRRYAFHLGLAFQYEDDLLDEGKADDMNCLAVLSRDEVLSRIACATDSACAALAGLPGREAAAFLAGLVRRLVQRKE